MILLVNAITLYRLPLFFLAYRGIVSHVLTLYGFTISIVIATWAIRTIMHVYSNRSLHTIALALGLFGFTASLFAIHIPYLAIAIVCVGISTGFYIRITPKNTTLR